MPPNEILYTITNGSNNVLKAIKDDGTNNSTLATYDATNVTAVAVNPTKVNQFAFASFNSATNKYKIYKGNSTLSTSTGTLLSATTYDFVQDMEFTPDGNYVIFGADAGTGFKMYRIAITGGSVLALDSFFEFSVSPIVGSHLIAYSKPVLSTSEIFTFDYITGTSTQITAQGNNVFSPTWSRDGNTLLFVMSQTIGLDSDIFKAPATVGGAVTRITNTPSLGKSFAFFNEDSTKIADIQFNGAGTQTIQIITNNGTTYNQIIADDSLQPILYWTDSNGRSISVNMPHYRFGRHPRFR